MPHVQAVQQTSKDEVPMGAEADLMLQQQQQQQGRQQVSEQHEGTLVGMVRRVLCRWPAHAGLLLLQSEGQAQDTLVHMCCRWGVGHARCVCVCACVRVCLHCSAAALQGRALLLWEAPLAPCGIYVYTYI